MNLILFGYSGSGKTHFGRMLAQNMRRTFLDTDDLLLDLYKKEYGEEKTIREMYQALGKERFRELESRALHGLEKGKNLIIALGGGTILKPSNVQFLQSIGAMVFLKTSPQTLKKRIFAKGIPSFLDPLDPEGSFDQVLKERDPIYRSIPARVVDTDILDEAGVLAALRSILLLEEPPNGF
ncbi:MAG: hypothetical protein A3D96_05700 [Chlamydiae bacterium RIFCSPHIGHO2_12_FULL_44_59]|nr:MAG: hypothetical protein A2796_03530 [Chlamydiae bacterium RIFCSPHIGHO2_01_FULL_44_39]OGN59114.1 MAG: hypothetical protein A3C42_02545 [Chlamydiae bacterium RIFCSPHIGHO2_02_FULL_45_9]OGN61125.1 MAG: hypothetical protein A3D96_05700 [Chlamydiae bacterium RIFCSPHIGHO2_12_FULL_44_59]OGN65595.1 MAG: hypothetical protein A2978_06505 [Chlamydiae bacterium RIFCSPLOWO2_01_FULL_44_52]OGN68072.1 MAG: hypothetical protein A3I67_05175 [Chlamydiae bacterium RIFCSPLOWO2_02_FULL_45_22]OGN68961.1 MAG: hyp